MSRGSRIFLAGSALFCAGTIWGVHYLQERESDNMYQGVIKDEARMKARALARLDSASGPSSTSSSSLSPLNTPSSPARAPGTPIPIPTPSPSTSPGPGPGPVQQPPPVLADDCETCHISPPPQLLEAASAEQRARERAARAQEYDAQRGLAERLKEEQGVARLAGDKGGSGSRWV